MTANNQCLSKGQIKDFWRNGYIVVPQWLGGTSLRDMQQSALYAAAKPTAPWELEAALGYPGAPTAGALGAATTRRLLGAYLRSELWRQFAIGAPMQLSLSQLFECKDIYMSQAHHNCLMTKAPEFSSDTGWHQDIRYWSYQQPNLISVWLALGHELRENGGLVVIPGSHRLELDARQFDQNLFFKSDEQQNRDLIEQAKVVELNPGDVLFFHCRLLHRASRNLTEKTKLSLVFTYSAEGNAPIEGTRSANMPLIKLDANL